MSLSDIADLSANPTFVRKVHGAVLKAAVEIGAEEYDGTQYRIMRRALATNVFKDPGGWAMVFAGPVAANAAITVESPDGDIEWSISSVWDAIAGAYQSTSSTPPPA